MTIDRDNGSTVYRVGSEDALERALHKLTVAAIRRCLVELTAEEAEAVRQAIARA